MKNLSIYRIALVKDGSLSYNTPLGEHVTGTVAAANILAAYLADADREQFVVLLLNQKNRITGVHTCHVGSLTGSLVSPREVFKAAIAGNAAKIIIAHNHPSGECAPSREDRVITERLKEAGKLLDIPILDHVIIGYPLLQDGFSYYSFSQEGLL